MKKLFIIILVMMFSSCSNNSYKKYGLKFNNQRLRIGLPILMGDWEVTNRGIDYNKFDFVVWSRKYDGKNYPYFLKKTIAYNSDTIIYEENQFIGLNTYNTIDGTYHEELFITYNFIELSLQNYNQKKGCVCIIKNELTCKNLHNGNLTINQADSVLQSWNLRRQ